jgi:hypothetical protein
MSTITQLSSSTTQTSSTSTKSTNSTTVEGEAKVATKLGKEVDTLEKQLLKAYQDKNLSESEVKGLELRYKNATLALEGFMQIIKSKHEILMRGIQSLLVR